MVLGESWAGVFFVVEFLSQGCRRLQCPERHAWTLMADMISTGQENDIVRPKKISGLAFHLSFNCFSPFNLLNCCFAA